MRAVIGLIVVCWTFSSFAGGSMVGGGSTGIRADISRSSMAIERSRLFSVAESDLSSRRSPPDDFSGRVKTLNRDDGVLGGGDAVSGGSGRLILKDGTKVTMIGKHHGEYFLEFESPDKIVFFKATGWRNFLQPLA